MKYKTFESLLLNCKDLYETACAKDRQLSDAFGSDTTVMTSWWDKFITVTISSIEAEYGDKNETVSWLFWDSMLSGEGYMDFEIDEITYLGSPKNVWMELEGILDERFSKVIVKKNEPEFNQEDMSTHFSTPTDEEILITLRASNIKVTPEFFNGVSERYNIDLHEVQKNRTYSLFDKYNTHYILTTKDDSINIQRNDSIEYGNTEMLLTKEEIIGAHDTSKLTKVSDLLSEEEQKYIESPSDAELAKYTKRGPSKLPVEKESMDKLLMLKDVQIKLQSIEASKTLEEKMSEALLEDVTLEEFNSILAFESKKLHTTAIRKNDIDRISKSFEMVLINLVGEKIDDCTREQAKFEVEKVLHNQKIYKVLSSYDVQINENIISGTIQWKNIDESPQNFEISIFPEMKIVFK